MNDLDDQDVFVSSEEEECEYIKKQFKCYRVALMMLAAGFCAIIVTKTIWLIIQRW